MSCADFFLAFIAILFPPIAVWIKVGVCTADSVINIALCCLGYLPGLLHAWYIIARYPEHDYDYEPIDNERGTERVTYYYVSHNQRGTGPEGEMNYGGTRHPQPKGQQQTGVVSNAPAPSNSSPAGASSSREQHVPGGENAPPTYDDAVKGDHKVQTAD
ncbi:hypothetical protein EPUS_00482 [Endocarpon pusillum Z07020]|uniref:Stress response RCI peptide n=1 Tax=Endocarpon pusillum (strain Z07020 / HMAS-L-300199) TaxID=1263415 RepID=U1GH91_ENDPU|nr:uncharacterized protein EPUS_00482 [Endocarpon pusillum Z07020]ERF71493.1 hypothetical protein EPUS_00482 [Endocarpon pusillum Z07020]